MKLWGVGIFALSLAAALTGLMTASCSDSNLGTGQGGDGGASGCPANAPTVGGACLLANGTSCNYGATETPNCECCGGGGTTYACDNGKWEEYATAGAGGAGIAPACPETLPEAGSPCSLATGGCGGEPAQICSFACRQGGTQNASCTGGVWTLLAASGDCSDDGGDDAGDGGDASDGG